MEASIQETARRSGVTSRTLRHYDAIGLLAPSRVGDNGYRWYDEAALVRLQRILLLRDLGLGLTEIGRALAAEDDDVAALRRHLEWLRSEQRRLTRQVAAIERTITSRTGGETIMTEQMFDGFDHTQHRDEVVERWGAQAYDTSDAWWRSMSAAEQQDWKAQTAALADEWARASGTDPAGPVGQDLARRHVAWLTSIPGTPAHHGPSSESSGGPSRAAAVKDYVVGLADLYVADERFARSYGGAEGAAFVRDALHLYAARHL